MVRLGIIGAMDEEVETLLAEMENKQKAIYAGCTFCAGVLGGLQAVIVRCGIGKVNAAMCTQALIDHYGVTHIVNTGIAGSLDATLDIGDLVVSKSAMYHDFDCMHFGYAMGQVPGTKEPHFHADNTLAALAKAAAEAVHPGHVREGGIASGDQFVSSKEKKDSIISVTHALCTEMEGAAIAQTAVRNDIPFVILRAISDKADDSAEMDYPVFEKQAAHRCAKIVLGLAKALTEQDS